MFQGRIIALVVVGLLACALDSASNQVRAESRIAVLTAKASRGEPLSGMLTADKKIAEPTPKQRSIAQAIGKGHSYDKHLVEAKEFPEIKTQDEFIQKIAHVIANPTHSKKLENDREAFYDLPSNTIVIVNPKTKDQGTCFRPNAKKRYYDNLK